MARVINSVKLYFKNVYADYSEVFKELHRDAKRRPLKASFYGASIVFVLNLFRTNEGLKSYASEVVSACNRLGAVSEGMRNPISNGYVQIIGELNGHRQLRQVDLGFSTLIYKTDSNPDVRLYRYTCKHLNPSLKEFFTEKLVDLGILGHWIKLETMMRNYDINEDEYKDLPD